MTLKTKHFGQVDIDESKVISFEQGIPGFPQLKKFSLMAQQDSSNNGMFYYLQSVEDGNTAFLVVDMLKCYPDYNPLVEASEISSLGNYNPDTFRFYNIAVVPENVKDATVNLKAPVVINTSNKVGKQVVCTNDEYTVSHFMFK